MTSRITSSTITDGQRKQFIRFLEDSGEKALVQSGIEKDGLQRLLENGGEFQDRIITAIKELSLTNQFVDQEVWSGYGYLSGYKTRSIVQQVGTLREYFPELVSTDLLATLEKHSFQLPVGAEGFFVIPHWSKVAPMYHAAVEKVLNLLATAYDGRFTNYRKGELTPNKLRETSKKVRAMEGLQRAQNADIFLVPAQFGVRHRGRSTRRARAVMNGSEFGLGVYENGIMLLTHPNRLQNEDDLLLDCAGDEFSWSNDGVFQRAPFFEFSKGRLRFGMRELDCINTRYGSASGFSFNQH